MAPWTILRRLALPLALAGLALAALAGPADASVLGPRAGHSPNADHIRTAYWVAIAIAVVLIVVIHGFLGVALLRFRARRGRTARRYTAGPGAFLRPALPLALVAIGLFVFGIVITSKTRDVQPTDPGGLSAQSSLVAQVGGLNVPSGTTPIEINVVGQRWLWRFDYPQQQEQPPYSTFSYNELVVPVHTPVILHITSTDVDPPLVRPGARRPGRRDSGARRRHLVQGRQGGHLPGSVDLLLRDLLRGRCAAWVKVVSPDAYKRFVAQKRKQIAAAQTFVQNAVAGDTTPGAPAVTPPTVAAPARPELVTEDTPRRRPAWVERATAADHKSVGAALHRRRRCASWSAGIVEFVADARPAHRPREHDDRARRSSTACCPPSG